jgi:peptidoglycan-associated lipoprotein
MLHLHTARTIVLPGLAALGVACLMGCTTTSTNLDQRASQVQARAAALPQPRTDVGPTAPEWAARVQQLEVQVGKLQSALQPQVPPATASVSPMAPVPAPMPMSASPLVPSVAAAPTPGVQPAMAPMAALPTGSQWPVNPPQPPAPVASAPAPVAAVAPTPAATKAQASSPAPTSAKRQVLGVDDQIKFAREQTQPSAEARQALAALAAKLLAENPSVTIDIQGHADDGRGRSYNHALGLARAQSVREVLVQAGFAAAHITVSTVGNTQPASKGRSEADHAKNRRVVLRLVR